MATTQESVRIDNTKKVERVFARAYLSSGQSNLTGNAWNKINLNAVSTDLGANFDTATSKFVVPVTGLYDVIGAVEFTSVITDQRYLVAVYREGVSIREVSGHASKAVNVTVELHDRFFFQEGDEIELYAQPEVGGGTDTVDVVSGVKATILVLELVSKEGIRQ